MFGKCSSNIHEVLFGSHSCNFYSFQVKGNSCFSLELLEELCGQRPLLSVTSSAYFKVKLVCKLTLLHNFSSGEHEMVRIVNCTEL